MMNLSRSNLTNVTTDKNFQTPDSEIIAVALVIAVSLVGNHLIIFAFINNFKMRTVTNKMVVNLCVVDIISALIDVPFYLVPSRTHPELVQQDGFYCRLVLFMYHFTTAAATIGMFCTAVDRYLNLVYTSFRRLCHKKTKIMIVGVWCQAFLTALPWDLLWPSSKSSDLALLVCQRFPYIYSPGLNILGLSIFIKLWCVIIPFFVIVWVFGRILRTARIRRKIVVKDTSAITHSKSERFALRSYARSSITAVYLFTIYLITSTPFIFSVIYTMFINYANISPTFAFTVYYLFRLKGAFLPFMYILRNRNVLVYFERRLKYWYGAAGNLENSTPTADSTLQRSRSALGFIYQYRQSLMGRNKSRKREQSLSTKRTVQWQIFYTKQAKKELRSSFTDLSSVTNETGYSQVVITKWSREITVKEACTEDESGGKKEHTDKISNASTAGAQKQVALEQTISEEG